MNPIISIAKETWDSGDAHACAAEWLFQIARLADELDVPHEIDYTDPAGPLDLETALATGEDSAYWDAVMALWADQYPEELTPWTEDDMKLVAFLWGRRESTTFDLDRARRHVRVALLTFDRLFEMTKEED